MVFNITDFGAIADKSTDNADAIQKAVTRCSASGGGIVFIPSGTYLTSPIRLESNINLNLSPGAKLLFSTDINTYPIVKTRWEGTECHAIQPMIFCDGLENVSITGSGVIDGQGEYWWNILRNYRVGKIKLSEFDLVNKISKLNNAIDLSASGGGGIETGFLRPSLISIKNCKRVTLDGFTVQNSAFWNTHILYSDNITINNVMFKNPEDSPNTDGLDIDSSKNVRITGCTFDVGDDCVCIKSGIDKDGRRVGIPAENIIVSNCNMVHGHGGVVFGSEGAGGMKNIIINNCIFTGTDRGIRLKSRRGRGGFLKDLLIQNIHMTDVLCPFVFNLYYRCGAADEQISWASDRNAKPVSEETPFIKNIRIDNIVARNVHSAAGVFYGLPEMPIEDVFFSNIDIEMDEIGKEIIPAMDFNNTCLKKSGFYGHNLRNFSFDKVRVKGVSGSIFNFTDSEKINISSEYQDNGTTD